MKKILSVLLIISTLSLTLALPTCFASEYKKTESYKVISTEAKIKKLEDKLQAQEKRIKTLEKVKKDSSSDKFKDAFATASGAAMGVVLSAVKIVGIGLFVYALSGAIYDCDNDDECSADGKNFTNYFMYRLKEANYDYNPFYRAKFCDPLVNYCSYLFNKIKSLATNEKLEHDEL
ncbi:MAG: hypothetical protein IJ758_04225 [Clostridia bacterium]|nr:hypothetical protein [Clostridia bacterium]